MKIERLRKSHRKEIIIGVVLTVVIGGALTFRLTHSKYRYTQSIDLAEGVIHYEAPDFQIMNIKISEDGTNYSDNNTVPSSGYTLNTSKSTCNDGVSIEYNSGNLSFIGMSNSKVKCELYFDKEKKGSETLLANVTVNSGTPNFSNTATTDEGVFKAEDPMYGSTSTNKIYSYYWRGAVENNYVKFAGYCWRIIRINGDGSIRLIYDGTTCHSNGTNTAGSIAVKSQMYAGSSKNNKSYYVGWTWAATTDGEFQRPAKTAGHKTLTTEGTYSNARKQTEDWFNNTAKIGTNETYTSKIADGKFCNDREAGQPLFGESGYSKYWSISGTNFRYAGVTRLRGSYSPTFDCPSGDIYTLKVGLITADEVEFAGGNADMENKSYYLYNGQYYWTMSPFDWRDGAYVFYVLFDGSIGGYGVNGTTSGLRPVINLNSDVTFSSGNGTQENPYVIS